MSKLVFKTIAVFIIGMVGGIFADQIFWPYFIERSLFYQYRLEQSPIYVTEKKEIVIQENTALKNAVEKVEKTVVGIIAQPKKGIKIEGSGMIITSDGLIVTLADLVPQGAEFTFYIEGKPAAFQILKRDLKQNLALVKLEENRLSTAGFADLEKIGLAERIFLVGVVFEKETETQKTGVKFTAKKIVNEGIIKWLNENFIKTNILEKKEIAGSVLFDIDGNVVGLNTVDPVSEEVIAIPVTKIRNFTGF